MDVWRCDLDEIPHLTRTGLTQLSEVERRRAAAMRPTRVRARWIAGRVSLRQVLARYLSQDPVRIELRSGRHGKPELCDRSAGLRFNLSHSGGLALVAVTREFEVGVDLEQLLARADFSRLAELGLDPATARAVRAERPAGRAAAFYAAWVRREAVAKCHGVGLAAPLPDRPAAVASLPIDPNHAAAVAVAASTVPRPRRFVLG